MQTTKRCPRCGEDLVRLEDGTYDCRCARLESDQANQEYPGVDQTEEEG